MKSVTPVIQSHEMVVLVYMVLEAHSFLFTGYHTKMDYQFFPKKKWEESFAKYGENVVLGTMVRIVSKDRYCPILGEAHLFCTWEE